MTEVTFHYFVTFVSQVLKVSETTILGCVIPVTHVTKRERMVDLLELANELGFQPKRVALTNGGEYHSPCPLCSGKDRFIIWNAKGRYYCRRCECKGDMIQFCRDFLKLSFTESCAKVGIIKSQMQRKRDPSPIMEFTPKIAEEPPVLWQEKASDFINRTYTFLLRNQTALEQVYNRGFTFETIQKFKIGWNSVAQFIPRAIWGIEGECKQDGREAKLWLPNGCVIPTFKEGRVCKIKIRRSDWQEQDQYPKYVEVYGSMKCLSYYAESKERSDLPIVIVESELDAMLIQQEACDLCACLAIGGATKKPDRHTDQLLWRAPQLLFSLDFDEAGRKAYPFWKNRYEKVKPWPAPNEKSPGDALKAGVDLRKWVRTGLSCA